MIKTIIQFQKDLSLQACPLGCLEIWVNSSGKEYSDSIVPQIVGQFDKKL